MMTLAEKGQLLLKMLPWILLAVTWLYMYCNYEERKARKERENG